MFTIYNLVTKGSLIMIFLSSFLSSSYYLSLAISLFKFYVSSSYDLFKFNNYIITIVIVFTITVIIIIIIVIIIIIIIIIIIVILINITVTVILEKSSGGEFQARNPSGMVYPYSNVK